MGSFCYTKEVKMDKAIEELKNQLAELQDKLNNLEKLKEESEKDDEDWFPAVGSKYYAIDDSAQPIELIREYSDYDDGRLLMGNYFKTKAKVEQEIENRKNLVKLKLLAKRLSKECKKWPIDWLDPDQSKYFIFYDHIFEQLQIGFKASGKNIGAIYCTDELFLKKAIEEIGKKELEQLAKEGTI